MYDYFEIQLLHFLYALRKYVCWIVLFLLFFKGIAKNKTLQHLSLEFCQIGDSGVESKFLNLYMYVVKTLQVFLGLGQFLFAYFLPNLLLEMQVDFIISFLQSSVML